MSDAEHERIVADEMALEKRYAEEVQSRAKSYRLAAAQSAPNSWTAKSQSDASIVGELVGRVILAGPDPMLGDERDFYIGSEKCSGPDYEVFSWAAPVACTYYRKSREHHEWCDDVVGVRVFAHGGAGIVDYEDEAADGGSAAGLFPTRELTVPRAPGRPTGSSTPRVVKVPTDQERSDTAATEADSVPPSARAKAKPVPGPALRAPDLLRRQLAAPKRIAMSSVLATIQSDQYEAITLPANQSQILQGQPGTGKTIVAAHRAAYMLNDEAPEEAKPRGRVLILGPTVEYGRHILGALGKLIDDDTKYEVTSVPALLDDLAGLPPSPEPTQARQLMDVSSDLARLIDEALRRARLRVDEGERVTGKAVFGQLVGLLQDPPDQGLEAESVAFLRELVPYGFEEVRRRRSASHRGMLAYIGVRTLTGRQYPGHIIVDEAQDVHPIEWEVLGLLGNTGGWTILGDLNQRRTDHTITSWNMPAQLLAIEGDDGKAPVTVLERGYRSTSQIIKFASQLLPREERGLFSLQQDGELPTVTRVSPAKQVHEAVFRAVEADSARIGEGIVAIITVDPNRINRLLVNGGWKVVSSDPSTWQKDGKTVRLLTPERARGLEFDAVVVVEPADFPENYGRQGALYTSLTRANRFLTVVHSKPLPGRMKARP